MHTPRKLQARWRLRVVPGVSLALFYLWQRLLCMKGWMCRGQARYSRD